MTTALHNPVSDTSHYGWLIGPSTNLVSFIANEFIISGLTRRQLYAADLLPNLLALAKTHVPTMPPDAKASLDRLLNHSVDDAKFASDEVGNGFATILGHHAVAIWAAIETALEQTLVGLIRRVPGAHDLILASVPALNGEKFKTKTANDAEKALSMWERELRAHSFDRALQMLAVFGVHVAISDSHREALTELSEVRNVLMHRGGFVDERFLGKCPWLKLKAGDEFRVTEGRFETYTDAASKLAVALTGAIVASPHVDTSPVTDKGN